MQIVIDIPEELKQKIDEGFTNQAIINKLWDATRNGTPLPKGHGRIVDGDTILLWLIDRKILDKLKCGEVAEVFERATVLEADMEDKE